MQLIEVMDDLSFWACSCASDEILVGGLIVGIGVTFIGVYLSAGASDHPNDSKGLVDMVIPIRMFVRTLLQLPYTVL